MPSIRGEPLERTVWRSRLAPNAPTLLRSMFECAVEAIADTPRLDNERRPEWEPWRAGEARPARRHDLTVLALAGDDVVGYATLDVFDDPVSFPALTGVKRARRARGIGRALKLRRVALAKAAGLGDS